jgi:hypothetical protein
VTIGAHDE